MTKQDRLLLAGMFVIAAAGFITGFTSRWFYWERLAPAPTRPVQAYFTFNASIPPSNVERMTQAAMKGILPGFK